MLQSRFICSVFCLIVGLLSTLGAFAQVRVSFIVSSSQNISGDRIYVMGNHPYLGSWNEPGTELFKASEGAWLRMFQFNHGENITFKIRRSQANTYAYALDFPGNILEYSFTVKRDTVIDLKIAAWQDKGTTASFPSNTSSVLAATPREIGQFRQHTGLMSEGVPAHTVTVWLPKNYDNSQARYPVLYVNEGRKSSYSSPEMGAMRKTVYQIADSLMQQHYVRDFIVVEIDNSTDYNFNEFSHNLNASYRKFVAERLKPFIDQNYRTLSDADNTTTMGYDIAGLTAFLLAWQNRNFGKAICLSPRFDWEAQYFTYAKLIKDTNVIPHAYFYLDNGSSPNEKRRSEGVARVYQLLQQKGINCSLEDVYFAQSNTERIVQALIRVFPFY